MASPANEFSFLPAQADALGVSVPQVERVTATTTNGTVSALRFGTEAPVVTFLHGAGLNAHTWDTTVLALGVPTLVIDLPGHGDSAWRDDATYAPGVIGETVAEAIAQLTSRTQVLVGHSLGGLTATWIAANHPELVADLVVVDITPGIDAKTGPAILRQFYEVLEFPTRDAVVDRAQQFGFGGNRADTERGVYFNTRVREDGVVEWKHHFASLANAILPTETKTTALVDASGWADLANTAANITLVRGTQGFVGDEALAEFRTKVPRATVLETATGHNVHEQAPTALADIISNRLSAI